MKEMIPNDYDDEFKTVWKFCRSCFCFSYTLPKNKNCESCKLMVLHEKQLRNLKKRHTTELIELKKLQLKNIIKINKRIKSPASMRRYFMRTYFKKLNKQKKEFNKKAYQREYRQNKKELNKK